MQSQVSSSKSSQASLGTGLASNPQYQRLMRTNPQLAKIIANNPGLASGVMNGSVFRSNTRRVTKYYNDDYESYDGMRTCFIFGNMQISIVFRNLGFRLKPLHLRHGFIFELVVIFIFMHISKCLIFK